MCSRPGDLWEKLIEIELPVGVIEQIKTLMVERMHSGNQRIEIIIPLHYRVGTETETEVFGFSKEDRDEVPSVTIPGKTRRIK